MPRDNVKMNISPNYQQKSFNLNINNRQLQTYPSFGMKKKLLKAIIPSAAPIAPITAGTVLAMQNFITTLRTKINGTEKSNENHIVSPDIPKWISDIYYKVNKSKSGIITQDEIDKLDRAKEGIGTIYIFEAGMDLHSFVNKNRSVFAGYVDFDEEDSVTLRYERSIERSMPHREIIRPVVSDTVINDPKTDDTEEDFSIKIGEGPCKIKPAVMKIIDGKRLVREYDNLIADGIIPGIMQIDYDNDWNMFFNKELNPKIIKEITSPITDRAINLRPDDLEICRTMAAATNIDDNSIISTDGVYQCAVVGIVDREQNLQSLLHCHAYDTEADIQKVLQYILDFSKDSKDIEISLIPGCRITTDCTVTCLNQVIKKIRPDAKINYLDFPNDIGERDGNIAYVMQNGEIGFCRDTDLLKNKDSNPLNEVIYFEQKIVR